MKWDVFISHASEDKKSVAVPLYNSLKNKGLKVWIDESQIDLGDSFRSKIDEGIGNSKLGIIILSRNFFNKKWPTTELDAIIGLEIGNHFKILPILYGITNDYVSNVSPILASRKSINWNVGLAKITSTIINIVSKSVNVVEADSSRIETNIPDETEEHTEKTGLIYDFIEIESPNWSSAQYLKFSLANTQSSGILFIDQINLTVIKCIKSERLHKPCEGAIWKPYEYDIHLSPDKNNYLISNQGFFLRPNDMDGFRIKLTSRKSCIYEFKMEFKWRFVGNSSIESLSSPVYKIEFEIFDTDEAISNIRKLT